jgi:hypothetical protein
MECDLDDDDLASFLPSQNIHIEDVHIGQFNELCQEL